MIDVPGTNGVPIASIKAINPPRAAWTGSVKAGAIVTRGNSDTENFNFQLDASRRTEKHRITASAGYFFGRQRDPNTGQRSTTADNWFALGKYDYFFSPKLYGYAQTRVEQDRVAELALRVSPGIGAGYQWYEMPDFSLSTEAGLNWVYERYYSDGDDEHVAGRLAYHVEKKINDKVTLFHDVEYLPSLEMIDDFNVNADAGMRTTIYKNLFSELKAEWQYDSTPAPGAQSDDFRYTLSVGWNF
jgi:putative salt-induced outer membrane protein YdiY